MKKILVIAMSVLFLTFLGVQLFNNEKEISIANVKIENTNNNELIGDVNYNIQPKSEIHTNNLDSIEAKANHIIFETVEELYNDSDLIVVGEVLEDKVNYAAEYNSDTIMLSDPFVGFTSTNIKINKVIKADAVRQEEYNKKNVNVLEPLFIRDNTLFTYEDYTELVEGAKYILFLKYSEKHKAYWGNSIYQGKYNIDNKDIKEKGLEIQNQHYKDLKSEVKKKYN